MKTVLYTTPKCGTHYLSQAIAKVIGAKGNIFSGELYETIPHINRMEDINFEQQIFSTHPTQMPYDEIPAELKDHLFLSMYRNPLDVTISKYFFHIKHRDLDVAFGDFFSEHFIDTCDEICAHADFITSIGGHNISYEYCVANPVELLQGMFDIFGEDSRGIDIEACANEISIEKAKSSEKNNGFFKVGDIQNGPFYRDGSLFQYRKYFNEEIRKEIESQVPRKLMKSILELGYDFS